MTGVAVGVLVYLTNFVTQDEVEALFIRASAILWTVILVVAVFTIIIVISHLIPKKEY